MANATRTVTKEFVERVRVTLDLTQEEAQALRNILGWVIIKPYNDSRVRELKEHWHEMFKAVSPYTDYDNTTGDLLRTYASFQS